MPRSGSNPYWYDAAQSGCLRGGPARDTGRGCPPVRDGRRVPRSPRRLPRLWLQPMRASRHGTAAVLCLGPSAGCGRRPVRTRIAPQENDTISFGLSFQDAAADIRESPEHFRVFLFYTDTWSTARYGVGGVSGNGATVHQHRTSG